MSICHLVLLSFEQDATSSWARGGIVMRRRRGARPRVRVLFRCKACAPLGHAQGPGSGPVRTTRAGENGDTGQKKAGDHPGDLELRVVVITPFLLQERVPWDADFEGFSAAGKLYHNPSATMNNLARAVRVPRCTQDVIAVQAVAALEF